MSLKSKFLVALIVFIYLLFISFDLGEHGDYAHLTASFILPLIAILYTISVKKKTLFFSLFVYCFAMSDFASLFSGIMPNNLDYYLGNALYIIAYACLLIEILNSINFRSVWQNFRFHLFVLAFFSFYALYELQDIIIRSSSANLFFEFFYNGILVSLLCSAIINYFYRDDKKSMYLLIGSVLLISYEVIGIAYLYLTKKCILNVISTTFLILAFYFLYQQARMKYSNKKQSNYIINNS
ncbi:hypothetical protein [Gaetbulibacter aestuarii]|uniref:YhhN-like protein n=1 Tax=Gaetbulibacter aestuarii TaxID=1502358 RepID=A0ABW7N2A0_9FLAO